MKKVRNLCCLLVGIAIAVFTVVINRFNFSAGGGGFPISVLSVIQDWTWQHPIANKKNGSPIIVGHRGVGIELKGGKGIAGNTMRSIRKAVASKADWVEIDVRKSADGTLYLFHDVGVLRVTNAAQVFPGRDDWSFGSFSDQEIKRMRIDYPGNGSWIPTLAQVLGKFSPNEGVKFILDLKEEVTADELNGAIGDLDPSRVILFGKQSCLDPFKDDVSDPGRVKYQLGYTALWSELGNKFQFLVDYKYRFLRARCKDLNCQYLVVPSMFLNQSLIENVRNDKDLPGIKILVYGIDEDQPYKVTDMGVDGVIVDDPKNARRKYYGK